MDFANVVSYEQEYPVKLLHPVTGEELGITFNVVSFESERVVKAAKVVEADRWKAVFENDDKKLTPEQFSEFNDKIEREQVIASISSWDWGDNNFDKLTPESECNEENKRYLIEHKNAKWIRDQIVNRSADIANFTQTLPKTSARSSKRK